MDEVPTQAPDCVISPVLRFGQWNHRKIKPCAARGAGEDPLSVVDSCPRRKICWGFRSTRNPSTSPHKAAGIRPPGGDGLRPAGAREGEHSPTVRQCGNASLAGFMKTRSNYVIRSPVSLKQKRPIMEDSLPLSGAAIDY